METPRALGDRVTVLEQQVETVTTRMGTLETDLKTVSAALHDGFARVDAEFTQVRGEMQSGFRALEYQINTTADRFETMVRESEQRIVKTTDERRQAALHATEARIDERLKGAFAAADERMRTAIHDAEQRSDGRTQTAIGSAEQRIDQRVQTAIQNAEGRIDQRVQTALQNAEGRIDQRVQTAIQNAEARIDQRTRTAIESAVNASEERTHAAIRTGDEETRRYMRTLHEDVLDRLKAISDGRRL